MGRGDIVGVMYPCFHDVFAIGTDTTKLTNEWAMVEVPQNPTLIKNARLELDKCPTA